MSDEWFKSKIAPADAPEDGCQPGEAKALQDYLHKKMSAQEAAQALTQQIESTGDPYDNVYRLWGLMIDALVELPETDIENLIQLLNAIQKLPDPKPTEKEQSSGRSEAFSWRDLPRFGHMWADEHKQDHWRDTLSTHDPINRTQQRVKHLRTAYIEARLVVANIGAIPLDWGYDCVADALERRNAVTDIEIPAAAQWIAVAGKKLYAGAVEGRTSWALERKRHCGREDPVMSLERWGFWVKRMEEMRAQAEFVVNAAQAAGTYMQAVSTGTI